MLDMNDIAVDSETVANRHRLAALRSFAIDGVDDRKPFDDIARMAATLTGQPIAIVSVVESERQWFLARHGLELAETPIEQSICRHIIHLDSVSVIEDTRTDPRTRENPLCLGDQGIQFYAGAPLVTDTGQRLGALAVLGLAPSSLTGFQTELLEMLARQVMAQLNLRRALRRSEMMRREVDHRVKNSLQSVAAMTRIQARAVTSDEAREALENVSRRINTVAALNQQMYRSGSDREALMQPFMSSIFDLMRDGLPDRITLSVDVDEITLDSRKAGAVAVIVNEFVTNSVKHAFNEEAGTVTVSLKNRPGNEIELICRDDGPGLGEVLPSDRLGLAIIDSAIDQLNAVKTDMEGPGHGIRVILRP
ncbi:Two-component sensor histidine kinase, contains HisKA and HATPase domains [Palleronia pelagia]|uniref:Two-component sensor histidine kinase, contains HisKA and HATPase domains n=2 Tax=Palleronia pelagia TaxID=387096 RepID=A0A1H8BVR4_9RHOB|nr:Two-component sensor histidine kinase, contains HisKA and HATPase domains [Palleronia pelagia]